MKVVAFTLGTALAATSFAMDHEGKHGGEMGTMDGAKAPSAEMQKQHMQSKMMGIDKDQDGKISQDEFMGYAEEQFKMLDSNGDSSVSAEEMQSHHQDMRQMKQEQMTKPSMGEGNQGLPGAE